MHVGVGQSPRTRHNSIVSPNPSRSDLTDRTCLGERFGDRILRGR